MLRVPEDVLYHPTTYTYEGRMYTLLKSISDLTTITLPDNPLILDAGCSSGCTTIDIAKFFPSSTVVGIDMNPEVAAEKYGHIMSKVMNETEDSVLERVIFSRDNMFDLNETIQEVDLIIMANNILFKLTEEEITNHDEDTVNQLICEHLLSSIQKLRVNGYLILGLALPGSFKPKFIILQKTALDEVILLFDNLQKAKGPARNENLHQIVTLLNEKLSEA